MASLFEQYDLLAASGLFNAEFYRASNPELSASNMDPLLHYIEHGGQAGRNPSPYFDTAFYLEQCQQCGERPDNPLYHYLSTGRALGLAIRPPGGAALPKPPPRARAPGRPTAARRAKRVEAEKIIPQTLGNSPFQGCLDALAEDHRLEGWARDRRDTFCHLDLAVLIDGRIAGTGRADLFRRDLLDAKLGHGCYAFRIYLDQLAPGKPFEAILVERRSGTQIDGPKLFKAPSKRVSPPVPIVEVLRDPIDETNAADLLCAIESDLQRFMTQHGASTLVDYAYCYALGRWADPDGLAAYTRHVTSGNLPAFGLITELLKSEEATKRGKKLTSPVPDFISFDQLPES